MGEIVFTLISISKITMFFRNVQTVPRGFGISVGEDVKAPRKCFSFHMFKAGDEFVLSSQDTQKQFRGLAYKKGPFCNEISQRGLCVARLSPSEPSWTLDQLIGIIYSGIVFFAYIFNDKIDYFVAERQRLKLGICKKCGGQNSFTTCHVDGRPM